MGHDNYLFIVAICLIGVEFLRAAGNLWFDLKELRAMEQSKKKEQKGCDICNLGFDYVDVIELVEHQDIEGEIPMQIARLDKPNYCPNCGKKLRKDNEE